MGTERSAEVRRLERSARRIGRARRMCEQQEHAHTACECSLTAKYAQAKALLGSKIAETERLRQRLSAERSERAYAERAREASDARLHALQWELASVQVSQRSNERATTERTVQTDIPERCEPLTAHNDGDDDHGDDEDSSDSLNGAASGRVVQPIIAKLRHKLTVANERIRYAFWCVLQTSGNDCISTLSIRVELVLVLVYRELEGRVEEQQHQPSEQSGGSERHKRERREALVPIVNAGT